MTTGRINQVSILRVRSCGAPEERPRLVTPHPRRGDQDIYKVGGAAGTPRPARELPGAEAAGERRGPSNCPP